MCITKISWRGGGVYLGGSLMEGKWTFGGHTDISLEVAAQLEREGGEERKGRRKKGAERTLMPRRASVILL
jgi:hypothetical protein